ncbi:hypothetical protein WJX72_004541 [[Myrmecia] bisecta]|uniref:non-specific serine/threonine protein kinase n=1 Tax=[Myrmecia] bisecta TaxID=41462 RepID=A0AAW1Q221_9CHLO
MGICDGGCFVGLHEALDALHHVSDQAEHPAPEAWYQALSKQSHRNLMRLRREVGPLSEAEAHVRSQALRYPARIVHRGHATRFDIALMSYQNDTRRLSSLMADTSGTIPEIWEDVIHQGDGTRCVYATIGPPAGCALFGDVIVTFKRHRSLTLWATVVNAYTWSLQFPPFAPLMHRPYFETMDRLQNQTTAIESAQSQFLEGNVIVLQDVDEMLEPGMKNKPVSDVFRKRVGRYYVGRTLGEGTYAKVKYGQHMDTGEAVAIKVLNKDELIRADMVSQIKREIRIMKNLHHPNVVDLKEVVASKDKVYMVMELMAGGELFDKVVAEGPFKEEEGRRVLQQLLDGLEYVHKQGIYHRDLKPENVLLSADGSVKLSDFGLGALPTHGREDGLLRTTCGTPNYVAPEVLQRNGYEGAPADIWSLGVCLYVVMAGSLPFDEPNLPSLFRKISRADYSTPIWFSPGLCQVLQGMLQPDPEKRATIEQLRQHPWVRKDYHQPRQLARTSTDSEDIDTSVDIFGATVKMHHLTPEEQRDSLKQMPRLTSMGSMQGGASSLKHLNAFEMINAALDISSLFERRDDVVRRHTRFTSKQPKATVLSKLEAAAVSMGGSVRRRSQYRAKLTMPGARGPVSLAVEVFDVIPGTSLAECVKAKGDTVDFYTAYAALTEHVQGLIANNLMRSGKRGKALADKLSLSPTNRGQTNSRK